ncbi:hypothetical protein MUN82_06625 [Hymenobacter aerilatus]|uniref:Uncharacterized protein n=1 Tax=Hymenobacter aerilatus TaxID=2932251 RepID=A0A8T9T2H5_9BACT|nr:hypothetical protein [Hymenobacter aerilatus]UOR06770.1 hypothetical protein MUN82_06625 [Hymenobacter aerilatus]
MLPLDSLQWQYFNGGYHSNYDVSAPLKKLEAATAPEDIAAILDELWEELHHQGDIGMASCMAVPHLVRIGIEKQITDWRLIGLVATIDIQRHKSSINIPPEYQQAYFSSMQNINRLIGINQALQWDRSFACCALAAVAASKGNYDMAEVILEFEDEDLTEKFEEFLDQY